MNDEYTPTIELSAKQCPEMKNWRVGGKYKMTIEVEQVGSDTGWDGEGPLRGRFKVLSASSDGKEYGYTDPSSKKPGRKDSIARLASRAEAEYDDEDD